MECVSFDLCGAVSLDVILFYSRERNGGCAYQCFIDSAGHCTRMTRGIRYTRYDGGSKDRNFIHGIQFFEAHSLRYFCVLACLPILFSFFRNG